MPDCGAVRKSLHKEVCTRGGLFYHVHTRAVKAECSLQNVFIAACASARGDLKSSFIHKYTVQGEIESNELFRFFPLPEKKSVF